MQVEKTATLVFKPNDAYKDYREFADWIFAAKALTLAYNPYGEWYFVDVDITRMEKAELTLYRTLEIPVVYKPKSPIYTPYDLNLVIEGEGDTNSKRYPYRYPYRYSDSSLAGVLEFTVPAQMPCAFNLTIPGEIQAPILTAKRMDTGRGGRSDSANRAKHGDSGVLPAPAERSHPVCACRNVACGRECSCEDIQVLQDGVTMEAFIKDRRTFTTESHDLVLDYEIKRSIYDTVSSVTIKTPST